jgi:actin related protein 2/3 complex subunit 4
MVFQIEPSINSIRVSIAIKQADEIEKLLCHKFMGFMMRRAENFVILRRKKIEGYDIRCPFEFFDLRTFRARDQ